MYFSTQNAFCYYVIFISIYDSYKRVQDECILTIDLFRDHIQYVFIYVFGIIS